MSEETSPAATDAGEYPSPLRGWYTVAVLLLAYISSIIDRVILGLLVEPIRKTMRVDDFQISLLAGVGFTLFYTVLGLPFGRLVDTRSRRLTAAWGVAMWSLATMYCGAVRNFGQLFAARIGVGVGEATLGPAAYSLIADYFPRARRGAAMSVYSMGISLGAGLAVIIGGVAAGYAANRPPVMLPFIGATPAWQIVFLWVGAPGLLIAALMLTIREPVRRGVTKGEPVSFLDLFRWVARHWRAFLCHTFAFGLFSIFLQGAGFWLPTVFIRTYGWTQREIGVTQGTMAAVLGTIGLVIGGRIADYWQSRGHTDAKLRVLLVCGVGVTVCGVLLPLMPNGRLAVAVYAPTIFFAMMPYGAAAAGVQELVPARLRGQAAALFLFTVNLLGGSVGPILIGALTKYVFAGNLRAAMVLATAVALTAGTTLFFLGLKPYRETVAAAAA